MTTVRKTLIDILESQAFERLEPFKHSAVWKSFAQEERLLLARLLVMQGAHQLAEGKHEALESFDTASQVALNAPEILYEQGNILSFYRENIRCLIIASQTLARALQQNPLFFKGWYLRAQVLTDIGLFEGEASYFLEASQNFEKASTLLDQAEEQFHRGEFFWRWGQCLAYLGRVSGEPLDFYRAIEKYRQAHLLKYQEAKFFNDFGHSLADLASLLEKPEYFAEALLFFNQAIECDPQGFDGWYHQACCMQSLAECKKDTDLLEQADRSFIRAVEINSHHSQLWLKWGQLEVSIGKLKRDQQRLESSLLKFAKAYQLESDLPEILNQWAETELFLGVQEERLDLIHSAKAKILNSLEIQPEDPNIWCLYGSCLNELGRYFNDDDHYYQAIEKFEYGLSLSPQHPLLCYGLATSYFALGELAEEEDLFEKAVFYCSRVVEFGAGDNFPQFWNDWGVALLKLAETTQQISHVEMAIEKFERAIKQPIQNLQGENLELEWIYNYGCAFDLLGDLKEEPHHIEKAIQILTQVLDIDSQYNAARYNLALALTHLAEAMFDVELYHKAIEHFQFLLDQDQEDEVIHLDFGMAVTNLGLLVHDIHYPERSQTLYRQAESHLMQAVALGNVQAYYQLAGLYSITGHYDHAMHYLERAQFCYMLPAVEDLLHDEWLEGLRQTPSFRQFINDLSSRQSTDDKNS